MKKNVLNLKKHDEQATNTQVALTPEALEAWKATDAGKEYFRNYVSVSEKDSAVTKGIETYSKKMLEKYVPKEEHEKIVNETKAEKEAIKIESAIDRALIKVKHPELLASQIKLSKNVKLNESGEIIGLNEEIEKLKTKYPEQFEEKKEEQKKIPNGNIPSGANVTGLTKEQIEALPMKERLAYKMELRKKNKIK